MPMEDYKKMYYELFNKITDAIENLKKSSRKQKKYSSLPMRICLLLQINN